MPHSPSRIERVAHRGASRERTENTLPAFELALERGADAIELDVHRTRDDVVVVHHDEQVAGRAIASMDWSAVAAVSLRGDARVPRLEDVLTLVGDRAGVYIELKGRGVEAGAIDVARRHGKRFALHSFDHQAVASALAIAPDIPRGVLLDRGTRDPVTALGEACRQAMPRDVWPHASLVDAAFMAAAAKHGLRVIVWTVNSEPEAARFLALGAAGICTDDVRILANL